jgi:leader peptidase (prepilin peptidase)/N-methyltransferase
MLEIIACLTLVIGLLLLVVLSDIDLRTRLLPNELVSAFLACGIVFHLSTVFYYAETLDMLSGGIIGFSTLFIIREIANAFYKQDTLGLGDVKLLGAAGIWLGAQHIMLALTIGALAGLLHGLGYAFYTRKKHGYFPPLASLAIPAGPGFAAGIVLTALIAFQDFPSVIRTHFGF